MNRKIAFVITIPKSAILAMIESLDLISTKFQMTNDTQAEYFVFRFSAQPMTLFSLGEIFKEQIIQERKEHQTK